MYCEWISPGSIPYVNLFVNSKITQPAYPTSQWEVFFSFLSLFSQRLNQATDSGSIDSLGWIFDFKECRGCQRCVKDARKNKRAVSVSTEDNRWEFKAHLLLKSIRLRRGREENGQSGQRFHWHSGERPVKSGRHVIMGDEKRGEERRKGH